MAGLFLYALAIVLMVRADLGLGPWDIFHVGVAGRLGWPLGRVSIVTGLAIIVLSYVAARIKPGAGTVANMICIGTFIDWLMPHMPVFRGWAVQVAVFGLGVLLEGLATRVYIGAGLGAGPRDGLMLGLSRITGRSIRLVRTRIEVTVLAAGALLGGKLGLGTVIFALGIGPAVQFFFRLFGEPGKTPYGPSPPAPLPRARGEGRHF